MGTRKFALNSTPSEASNSKGFEGGFKEKERTFGMNTESPCSETLNNFHHEPEREFEHDLSRRKIFLGGLRYTETEQSVQSHFQQFGEIESVLLPKDKNTGKPRGFGFVIFKEPGIAEHLAATNAHMFNGRFLDVKLAIPKRDKSLNSASIRGSASGGVSLASEGSRLGSASSSNASIEGDFQMDDSSRTTNGTRDVTEQGPQSAASSLNGDRKESETDPRYLTNRVFVGGLPDEASNAVLREYFSKFGTVIDSFVLIHAATKRPRGFGFVTFKDESVVPRVLSHPRHEILGKRVETRLATRRSAKEPEKASQFVYPEGRAGFPPGFVQSAMGPVYVGPLQQRMWEVNGNMGAPVSGVSSPVHAQRQGFNMVQGQGYPQLSPSHSTLSATSNLTQTSPIAAGTSVQILNGIPQPTLMTPNQQQPMINLANTQPTLTVPRNQSTSPVPFMPAATVGYRYSAYSQPHGPYYSVSTFVGAQLHPQGAQQLATSPVTIPNLQTQMENLNLQNATLGRN